VFDSSTRVRGVKRFQRDLNFGFPESHSVLFAYLAYLVYVSAWLTLPYRVMTASALVRIASTL
jgi:DNA polymerase III alpha subunit